MLSIQVTNEQQKGLVRKHESGPIELGRGEPRNKEVARLQIDDIYVSRNQIQIEEKPGPVIAVRNLSDHNSITLENEKTILPVGAIRELNLPAVLSVGKTEIRVSYVAPEKPEEIRSDEGYARLSRAFRAPEAAHDSVSDLGDSAQASQLAEWLETVIELQRGDIPPKELYAAIVLNMGKMIGLDLCLALLLRKGEKRPLVAGSFAADDKVNMRWSETLVNKVVKERQTFYQDLRTMPVLPVSINDIEAVVVSPIFGLNDEVAGVLYGMRRKGVLQRGGIRPLEARLVQLLAAAAGTSLARTEAIQTRVQFEQFFPPELVRELQSDRELLEGKNLEVSVLFSDLRGFTTLMQRLEPHVGCRILREVMERLSNQIVKHKGVIVDYAGDGILAMWNAPIAQPDHAQLACEAGLAMQAEMPGLNVTFKEELGPSVLALGVGINTGWARVGNTGSSRKFMYGPLGHSVNLASRVQDATKKLGLPVLITGTTQAKLPPSFATRRLGKVRVPGVNDPVDLYDLHGKAFDADWLHRKELYEKALELYENKQWSRACKTLMPLLSEDGQDGRDEPPLLKLMRRSWECLESKPDPFDPVIAITTKDM